MNRAFIGAMALIFAGCGFSPQTQYYALSPVESTQPSAVSGPPVRILRVTIPAVLDRESLVKWSGPGELSISEAERWAAPLDGMIQSVLAADLRQKLPGLVLMPGDPIPPGDSRGIMVNVRHFAADGAKRVVLLVDWSLISGSQAAPILTRYEDIDVPIGSNQGAEVVHAMSEALGVLSDRIASTLYPELHIVRR
jgi:uncharacterized lipoprotein YmbA